MSRTRYIFVTQVRRREYGFWAIVGDLFMLVITGGLWAFIILVREVRRARNR